jgi:hypothetical protein
VVSDGARVGGEVLPEVAGQARLKRGVIEFDFANQTEVQKRAATTQPLYWTYRIQVGATKDLRWRTQDADMEFDADLDLQQTPDSLLIYGEMRALRGSYQFLSTTFRIRNADITFDNQQGVDPLLDILADARVPLIADRLKNESRLETVTATLVGRSSQPAITLTSTSNADQRTIIDGLTLGLSSNVDLLGRAGSVADSYLARELNRTLDANLRDYFKGALTNWEFRRDQGSLVTGQGATYFGVTAPVSDKIAIRYQRRLFGQSDDPRISHLDPSDLFEQNVEAEYRVNRFIYITSGVQRRRVAPTSPLPTTDYNVNLKARWEY